MDGWALMPRLLVPQFSASGRVYRDVFELLHGAAPPEPMLRTGERIDRCDCTWWISTLVFGDRNGGSNVPVWGDNRAS